MEGGGAPRTAAPAGATTVAFTLVCDAEVRLVMLTRTLMLAPESAVFLLNVTVAASPRRVHVAEGEGAGPNSRRSQLRATAAAKPSVALAAAVPAITRSVT